MTTTSTTSVPDVHEMVVVHRVFRREFAALPDLIRAVGDGARGRAAIVAEHLRLLLDGLHLHHTGEDVVLWPLLLTRAAPSTRFVETMQDQHEAVEECVAGIEDALVAWRDDPTGQARERLAGLVEALHRTLVEHLDLEEREILPLIVRHVTVAEWRSVGEHGKDAMTARQLPLMFGSILEDADPDERRKMLATLPLPVRWLMATLGVRQYRRYISRVRAG